MPKLVSIEESCKRQGLDSMLKEFSSKNVIPADRIGYSSKTEVIWRCKHGHEEIESPYKRFRRGYCKTCGKDVYKRQVHDSNRTHTPDNSACCTEPAW